MTDVTIPAGMSAEERRDAWSGGFAQGEDGHYWDYAQWIAQMLRDALENVESLVGAENAAEPLRALLEPVVQNEGIRADTWREVFEEGLLSAGTVWPIARRVDEAGLYGLYGVTPRGIPLAERASWLDALVEEVEDLAARSDLAGTAGEDNAVIRIARIAQSRRALDTGRGEVHVDSLAILGGVSEGRLRNLMSGSSPTLERGPNGGVAAVSAMAWLERRKEFPRSIWDRDDEGGEDGSKSDAVPVDSAQMIFVPVARDGSMFQPDLKRAGRYQIGAKGEEQHFESFDDALTALNAMPTPHWRRPNERGHWGIVSGVAWQRVGRRANTE